MGQDRLFFQVRLQTRRIPAADILGLQCQLL